MKPILSLSLLTLMFTGCSSAPTNKGTEVGLRLEDSAYEKLIQTHTQSDKAYNGLNNTFQIHATQVNSEVQSALLQKYSDTLQWNTSTGLKEREKALQEMSSQSQFAVSFFTPTRRHNDLHKSISIWKLYLEHNGRRFEGTAQKKNLQIVQLKKLYPYHNRWSTAYTVTFKVPMTVLERQNSKLILTSMLGQTELKYSALPQ